MPKIGMRIIKSSIAVFLCLMISLLRSEGIVFYSCIAAVLCIQQDVANSKKVAVNRVKGTLLGGLTGMLILSIEKTFLGSEQLFFRYLLLSFTIIPLIYSTVLLKMTSAAYISCVVFMSITITHAMDVNPLLFAVNRMIDTFIGIFIALGLNAVHLSFYHDTTLLFLFDLDAFLAMKKKLHPAIEVKMKRLIEEKANICWISTKTPPEVLGVWEVFPTTQLIAMHGTVQYMASAMKYHCIELENDVYKQLLSILQEYQQAYFVYAVHHDVLHIYYDSLSNSAMKSMQQQLRTTPYITCVYGSLPKDTKAVMIQVIDKTFITQKIYQALQQSAIDFSMTIRQAEQHKDFSILEIYSDQASRQQAINTLLQQQSFTQAYVFTNQEAQYIENKRLHDIHCENMEGAVKKMSHLFHKRQVKK